MNIHVQDRSLTLLDVLRTHQFSPPNSANSPLMAIFSILWTIWFLREQPGSWSERTPKSAAWSSCTALKVAPAKRLLNVFHPGLPGHESSSRPEALLFFFVVVFIKNLNLLLSANHLVFYAALWAMKTLQIKTRGFRNDVACFSKYT